MDIKQLCQYFNKQDITIRKAIKKMCDSGLKKYKYLKDNKVIISFIKIEKTIDNKTNF